MRASTQPLAQATRTRIDALRADREARRSIGLAAAMLVSNALQLAFTLVFTRLLGATGYGSLAALISAFLVLFVCGSAVQAAAAREVALQRLGSSEQAARTLQHWSRSLAAVVLLVTVASILAREPIAHLIGVPEHPWGAAAVLPTGGLWMLVCLQRGALQGLHRFRVLTWSLIAEAVGRIGFGVLLYAAGAGVTGAYLGNAAAFVAVSIWLWLNLPAGGEPGPGRSLGALLRSEWRPVVGLLLLGVMQNVDVIVVKHRVGGDRAGAYAAAAVAAKAVVWVAVGIALHLLPEATRRTTTDEEAHPVLLRALSVLAVVAAPALIVFAAVPHLLLRVAFGAKLAQSSGILFELGLAMSLLSVSYLAVQYLLALADARFLFVVAPLAIVEPILLFAIHPSLGAFAALVLGVQVIGAAALAALAWRPRLSLPASRPSERPAA